MPVFAVLIDNDLSPAAMAEQVKKIYSDKSLQVSERSWFVSVQGESTQTICKKLGVPEEFRGVIVFELTATYWGAARKEIWDFLKKGFESSDG
jgi:hypothetical protein